MIIAQSVPLGIDRGSPRLFTIEITGIDLTNADLHAQIRLSPDAPGDPVVDLPKVTSGTVPGVRLIAVDNSGTLPISWIRVQIPAMATGTGPGQLPPAAELGDDVPLYWDMVVTPNGFTADRWFFGPVTVRASVTNTGTLAPLVDDPLPGADAVAKLIGADLSVTLAGAALIQPLVDRADGSAAAAIDAAAHAETKAQVATDAANTAIEQVGLALPKAGGQMTGILNMSGQRVEAVGAPDTDDDATNRGFVNTAIASVYSALSNFAASITAAVNGKLSLTGGGMTGILSMGNNRIEAVASPDSDDDAANAGYVKALVAAVSNILSGTGDPAQVSTNVQGLVNPIAFIIRDAAGNAPVGIDGAGALFAQVLKVLGGGASFGGDVAMLGHRLTGLATPTSDDHAVNRAAMNAAVSAALAAFGASQPLTAVSSDQVATANPQSLVNPLAVAIRDPAGNAAAGIDGSGALFAQALKVLAGGLMAGKVTLADFGALALGNGVQITATNGVAISFGQTNYDISICDVNGYPLAGWLNGKFYGPSASSDTLLLDEQDALNKAYSMRVAKRAIRSVQLPVAAFNIQYVYGQSLGQGDQTHPALSTTNKYGNLMLGGNVMSSTDNAVYTPFGSSTLQPLVAKTVNGSTQYDAAAEANLATTDGSRGEPVNHGWTNGSKLMFNDKLMVLNDTSRVFISVNIAKSGAVIGELEKNHTEGGTEMYGKYPSSLGQIITAAGGASVAVAGIMYMQGEFDYANSAPHNSTHLTYATYYPTLVKLAGDMQADAIATTGQARPPAFLIYQTGAAFTRDVDVNGLPGLHIGMAQLNFALTAPNAWMVGPIYPVTDRGGHLDSNGSRWFGHQIAKVWNRVVLEGRDWEPLRPIRIWSPDKQTIYVNYHVPEPPLVFDAPYVVNTPTMFAAKGYRVTDANGNVGISNVEIVRDTIVKITLSRAYVGTPYLWYAGQSTFNGNGNIRDSDPAVASDNYQFIPNRGMADAENIAALVDKPYPLWNWGVAFYYPVDGSLLYSQ